MNWKMRIVILSIGIMLVFSPNLFMKVLSFFYGWTGALEIWATNRLLFRLLFNPFLGFAILFGLACYLGVEDREKAIK